VIDFDFIGTDTYIAYRLPVSSEHRRDIHRIWHGKVIAVFRRTQIARVEMSHVDYEGFEELVHVSQIVGMSEDLLTLVRNYPTTEQ
jgi:hypothetical protein